jgi:hypothetical protein
MSNWSPEFEAIRKLPHEELAFTVQRQEREIKSLQELLKSDVRSEHKARIHTTRALCDVIGIEPGDISSEAEFMHCALRRIGQDLEVLGEHNIGEFLKQEASEIVYRIGRRLSAIAAVAPLVHDIGQKHGMGWDTVTNRMEAE